ncbi:MAG: FAD-binding protein [Alphaproteobacteria bacterium]|nr:FAD-binding protein [Alphaproteobacteria bacterium]
MTGTVHVVGAGLAGLAAAVDLVRTGRRVALYEAGPQAGGRCRSYHDPELGCRIDNGNHLLLSGNRATLAYLDAIGAADRLTGPDQPRFPFLDLALGERWTLALSPGRWPGWIFDAASRLPGTGAWDYLRALGLAWAGADATVAECLAGHGEVYRRLWQPFAVAALNTETETASARLLWAVMRETFERGGLACRPLVPRVDLSESLIEPALIFLARNRCLVKMSARLRRIDATRDWVTGLDMGGSTQAIGEDDAVVLAVPAPVAASLVEGLIVPTQFRAIVNAHYRMAVPRERAGEAGILGLVGGVAEWIFVKREVVSVTVSAADRVVDRPAEELAPAIWREVARALDLDAKAMPPARIVKERRATFAATPEQLARRPGPATRWRNLVLAGDWTATGLPGTIEGAVRSGQTAARALAAA